MVLDVLVTNFMLNVDKFFSIVVVIRLVGRIIYFDTVGFVIMVHSFILKYFTSFLFFKVLRSLKIFPMYFTLHVNTGSYKF